MVGYSLAGCVVCVMPILCLDCGGGWLLSFERVLAALGCVLF